MGAGGEGVVGVREGLPLPCNAASTELTLMTNTSPDFQRKHTHTSVLMHTNRHSCLHTSAHTHTHNLAGAHTPNFPLLIQQRHRDLSETHSDILLLDIINKKAQSFMANETALFTVTKVGGLLTSDMPSPVEGFSASHH